VDEAADADGAGGVIGVGAAATVIAAVGEPVVDDALGLDVFCCRVDETRFVDFVGAFATGCDFFFPRVDAWLLVDVFGVRTESSPASADTSSVQRTPRPRRAAGILIARFDKGRSPLTIAAIHVPANLLSKT